MAKKVEIICAVCGASTPASGERCRACGAKVDVFDGEEVRQSNPPTFQQSQFEWKWVAISFVIYIAVQAVVLGVLREAIAAYDPQGLPGLALSTAIWFVGGLMVGFMSSGRTFFEPAAGALLAVVPTTAWLHHIADVRELSMFAYIVGGGIGIMVAVMGALAGEKLQASMGR